MAAQQPTVSYSENMMIMKRFHISGLSLLHPQTLLFLVIRPMVMFTLVPPSIYVYAIKKSGLMFLNPIIYAFFAAYWAVVWFRMRVAIAILCLGSVCRFFYKDVYILDFFVSSNADNNPSSNKSMTNYG